MVRRWEKIRIPIFVWRGEYQFYFFSIHYTLQHLRISKDLCILDTMFFVAIKSVNTRYKRFFSQSWDMFIELATAFLYICQSESSYHLPSEPIASSPSVWMQFPLGDILGKYYVECLASIFPPDQNYKLANNQEMWL